MTRALTATTAALLAGLMVVGCGSDSSKKSDSTVTSGSTSTGNSTTTPISDVHGQMVVVAAGGSTTLAFLPDGASEALELDAPVTGAHEHSTLTLSGDVSTPNAVNVTALSESLTVSSAQLDDVSVTGRLQQTTALVFVSNDGETLEPTGPLASALLAEPLDTPIRVTGTYDNAHVPTAGGVGLRVTSWRATAEIRIRTAGGLLGVQDAFSVDDLTGTGAHRQRTTYLSNFGQERLGQGVLSETERATLEGLVTAANLRTQPTRFNQTMLVFDIPMQYVDYADRNGSLTIQIHRPTNLPPELDALIQHMSTLRQGLTSSRALETGAMSQVTTAGTQIVRDQAALTTLYGQHSPGATVPTVDFTKTFVVALFMGQQSTGGYAIEAERVRRTGDDVRIDVRRTVPSGIVTQVITSPFQIVAVDHAGATGDLYVDGVKQ